MSRTRAGYFSLTVGQIDTLEAPERIRRGLGDEVLKPYKATIDRWLWPDMFKNQDTSVSKAKKAISDYKKAHSCECSSRP